MSEDADERFVAFVDRESPELLRIAWYLTGDREDAHDLLQEALVRVYPRWGRLRHGQEAGYVRRTMVNLRRDAWRRRSLDRSLPWHRTTGVTGGEPAPDPAGEVAGRRTVVDLLHELPPRQRAVLVLRHVCDLSEQQVAAELGISVGTVKSTASRGLARVRELARDAGVGPEEPGDVPGTRPPINPAGDGMNGTDHGADTRQDDRKVTR